VDYGSAYSSDILFGIHRRTAGFLRAVSGGGFAGVAGGEGGFKMLNHCSFWQLLVLISSRIYFVRFEIGHFTTTEKVIYLK